jgi:hypothetical protein
MFAYLVSCGYVVLAVDHTYDAAVVEFHGGRPVTAAPREIPEGADPGKLETWDAVTERQRAVRTADVRFALDALDRLQAEENPDAENRALPAGLAGAPVCPGWACSATPWAARPLSRPCSPTHACGPDVPFDGSVP